MKILIDENLPKKLKNDLIEHSVYTVRDKNWHSKTNGDLIKLMIDDGFDLLITFDQNLQYQQNLVKCNIAVLVINTYNNQYETIKNYKDQILALVNQIDSQGVYILLPN
jgi:predicted nuclease of predicted toxin-antitoxin system